MSQSRQADANAAIALLAELFPARSLYTKGDGVRLRSAFVTTSSPRFAAPFNLTS
jgi:hypothetical protein